ncbi:MAG: PQQ-binding-like beta-propeller repeat protein [Cellulomonas sp.]
MGREDMQPVELAEEWTDATGSEAPTDPAVDPGHRWTRGRRRAAAVAALVVVGLVTAQVVIDAREHAHLAHLAEVPGVLRPLDPSVRALWTTDDDVTLGDLFGAAPVGDLSVGGHIDRVGERTVRAVRALTGEIVWSTVVAVADPAAQARGTGVGPSCSANDPADSPRLVVCLVTDAAYVASTDGPQTPVPATFARLVVIDPSTGEQRAQRDVPTTSAGQVGLVDGVVVLAWRSESGHLVASGTEPLTGDARWQLESPEALAPAPDARLDWRDASGIYLGVVADRVMITATGGELWLLSGAGTVIHQSPAGSSSQIQVPRPGVLTIADVDTSTGTARSQQVLHRDGTTTDLGTDLPMSFTADDGSAPNLLFTADGHLHAWDMTTGKLVWTSEPQVGSNAVLLDSRLYVRSASGHLLALDAATGSTLWDRPISDVNDDGTLLTDGHWMLAAQAGTTSGLTLVAYDLIDGHRTWDGPLPDSIAFLWVINHQLLGFHQQGDRATLLG